MATITIRDMPAEVRDELAARAARAGRSLQEHLRMLRQNLTAYDAWYVAVAERLDAPLATLDRRFMSAPGPMCRWLCPPDTP